MSLPKGLNREDVKKNAENPHVLRGLAVLFAFPLLVLALLGAQRAFAADPPATNALAQSDHYCVACHSENDPRVSAPLDWGGGLTHAQLSPCPAVQQLAQEIAYTDQAFDAIANGQNSLAMRGMPMASIDQRVLAREESLPRLFETSYRTVDAGVNEARAFRYQLNKTYAQVQSERGAWTTNVLLVVGILVTLFLLASLAWGYANTRNLKSSVPRVGPWSALFILLVFIVFALPIFNPPAESADVATPAGLERQTALDAATRAAVSAENESAKAWELAQLSAAWSPLGAGQAQLALTAAYSATNELALNADAYWGAARALEESAVTWNKAPGAAPPVVQRVAVDAGRVWAYPAMADEIVATDSRRARGLLQTALSRAAQEPDPYFRALDLKKIAVAYAQLDPAQADAVANQIEDPFIRAWAFRELGQFNDAAVSARQISDMYLRGWALRAIGVAAQDTALLNEALTLAQTLTDPTARAYALADLAAAFDETNPARAAELADSIAPAAHAARAYAFLRLGRFSDAWSESQKLDGFERSRAQDEIVAAWARTSPNDALAAAQDIRDPFWRAQAQRTVVAALAPTDAARARDLARGITIPFAQVQALTEIGRATRDTASFQEAASLADQLHDPYPLCDLIAAWAPLEPPKALVLVDKLDRESDRAQALLAVALALASSDHAQANAVFDRAVKQAKAARLFGDALYSSELLRELGTRYAAVDSAKAAEAFQDALDATEKVTTGF
jgi:hypothetical protein